MNKVFITLTLLSASLLTHAQDHWGPWNNVACWKGLHFHLSNGGPSGNTGKNSWSCQFRNDYTEDISFEFTILAPAELETYMAGKWSPDQLGHNGRITLKAGEDQSRDPKDWFGVQPSTGGGLFASSHTLYVIVTNVRFGDDAHDKPFATDECGKPSGKDPITRSSTGNEKTAQLTLSEGASQEESPAAPVAAAPTPTPVVAPTHASAVATAPAPTASAPAPAQGLTATQQQTQRYIDQARQPGNDAIQTSLAINQASINGMQNGGSTATQQAQIQRLRQAQSQANSAAINSALGDFASTLNSIAEQRQQRAEWQAMDAEWHEQYRRRSLVYGTIGTYSDLYLDTSFLMQSPYSYSISNPDDNLDDWNIYTDRRAADIQEALSHNDGQAVLEGISNRLDYRISRNGEAVEFGFPPFLSNPFDDMVEVKGKYGPSKEKAMKTILVDTRSKKEKKTPNPTDLRELLPEMAGAYDISVDADGLFNKAYGPDYKKRFEGAFDTYLGAYGSLASVALMTQWLYQAKADLEYQSGEFKKALDDLQRADDLCTPSVFSSGAMGMPYDLGRFSYADYYWSNLLRIRIGEWATLNQLCKDSTISAEQKVAYGTQVLLLYYKTRNDLAGVFGVSWLALVPRKVTIH
ncbi:MAG TPA: hypothetical protein VL547_13840 [Dinghuibacter sp.]|uniref:hypothetical protein n=1 Tax=Dinghuibacter sp. TaxID=2024697 RepID=UPI002C6DC6F3|nr:hypothetical protein [Dinghuibacter sp.]HTJ13110.1 hypothetical protein [Dinghuibacter sp.]